MSSFSLSEKDQYRDTCSLKSDDIWHLHRVYFKATHSTNEDLRAFLCTRRLFRTKSFGFHVHACTLSADQTSNPRRPKRSPLLPSFHRCFTSTPVRRRRVSSRIGLVPGKKFHFKLLGFPKRDNATSLCSWIEVCAIYFYFLIKVCQ